MNLTGHWKGEYTFGKGYSPNIIGKSDPFEFEIKDEGGLLSGSCIDNVVKGMEGNESFIHGVFKEGNIKFKKTYKYHLAINESNEMVLDEGIKLDGVDYTGQLYRTFFSRKPRFKGKWTIPMEFEDENNDIQTYLCEGTWKMKKID